MYTKENLQNLLNSKGATKVEIARLIAMQIKEDIAKQTADGKIKHATLATSLSLHIALEAIAKVVEVDKTWFKQECGIGQPLAYFI